MGCVRDRGSKAFLLIGREKRKRTTKDVDRMSPEGEIQPNSPTAQSPEEFEYGLEMSERERGRLSWPGGRRGCRCGCGCGRGTIILAGFLVAWLILTVILHHHLFILLVHRVPGSLGGLVGDGGKYPCCQSTRDRLLTGP